MSEFFPPLVLELRAKAGEFRQEMGHARKEIDELAKKSEEGSSRSSKAFKGMATAGKVVAFAAVGAGIAIGGFAVEAAMAGEKAEATLNTALKNAGSSFEELKGPIDDADAQMRKFGYTNADTNQALAQMTVALGDPKKALADLSIASDLARLKGISLAQAGILVAKAAEGQLRPLKALGIDLPVAAGGAKAVAAAQANLATATQKAKTFLDAHSDAVQKGSKYHLTYMQMVDKVHAAQKKLTGTQGASQAILAALSTRIHGTAAAYGDTLAGKMAAARAQLDSFGETIGKVLIPIITKVIGIATGWAQGLAKNKTALIAIGVVVGTVVVTAIGAYIASLLIATATSIASFGAMIAKIVMWTAVQLGAAGATEGVTAAQWLLNAALSANPIGLVVLAIVGLVAIFVVAYKKVGWFHDAINAAFHGIKVAIGWISSAVGDVISFVKGHWQLILAILIGPVGLAIKWVHDHWAGVTKVFSDVVHAITGAVANVGNILLAPFKWAFNMVATIWNDTIGKIGFDLPGWLGGGSFHMPQIPHMAAGGTMARTGMALVGEEGPELVKLPGGAHVYPHGIGPSTASVSGGGGGNHYHTHVHFDGPVTGDPSQVATLARALSPHLQTEWLRFRDRNGFNPLGQAG